MTAYKDLSKEELLELKSGLEAQYEEVKEKGLKLDMSRGKPSADQLNLSMGMMDVLNSGVELSCEDGVDGAGCSFFLLVSLSCSSVCLEGACFAGSLVTLLPSWKLWSKACL